MLVLSTAVFPESPSVLLKSKSVSLIRPTFISQIHGVPPRFSLPFKYFASADPRIYLNVMYIPGFGRWPLGLFFSRATLISNGFAGFLSGKRSGKACGLFRAYKPPEAFAILAPKIFPIMEERFANSTVLDSGSEPFSTSCWSMKSKFLYVEANATLNWSCVRQQILLRGPSFLK